MIKWMRRLIALAVLGSSLAIGLGFFGALHPAFDTFAHFRMHLSVCLILAFFVLLFTHYRAIPILGLVMGVLGFYTSQDAYRWSATTLEPVAKFETYELLHLNLLWNNPNRKPVMDEIFERDPDILSLSESSRQWLPQLARLDERWPHLHNCPENGPRGGVRIYSKWPMNISNSYCGVYGTFGTIAVTSPKGKTIHLGSVHLRWPWPASGPKQLETFIPTLEKLPKDVLIAGDFNSTPWARTVTRFANTGGLSIIPGIGPTWLFEELPPSVAATIGLPIDHIMSKGKVRVLKAERLASVGSDHFPILVQFQIEE